MKLPVVLALLVLWTTSALAADPPSFVRRWGSTGAGNGQLYSPNGLCIDSQNIVYVADRGNDRIQTFDTHGNFIATFGTTGTDTGQFISPRDVAVSRDGHVFVGDDTGINVYTREFVFIRQWSMGLRAAQHLELDPTQQFLLGISGPTILKYDLVGNLIAEWSHSDRALGQGIGVGPSGTIYVTGHDEILRYDSQGHFLGRWGRFGLGNGEFMGPQALGVDEDENVFVADGSSRLQQFAGTGQFLNIWGGIGTGDGEFLSAVDFAFDANGDIFVLDQDARQIQVFTSSSTTVIPTSWGALKQLYK